MPASHTAGGHFLAGLWGKVTGNGEAVRLELGWVWGSGKGHTQDT